MRSSGTERTRRIGRIAKLGAHAFHDPLISMVLADIHGIGIGFGAVADRIDDREAEERRIGTELCRVDHAQHIAVCLLPHPQKFLAASQRRDAADVDGALVADASAPEAHAASRGRTVRNSRSEEHTSELQSLMRISYAVFCWKKKKSKHQRRT